ncbi:MAG: hypoxanthine phosphoribosyltransferase [Candidatus Diapherotrites archaeon]|nr:hypoxanthine phosphoribosyltransferase [Candidatus Diapherotrites archaeon]
MHKVVRDFSKTVVVPPEGIRLAYEPEPKVRSKYRQEIEEVLITKGCLQARVEGLAKEIKEAFADINEITCLVVLKGGMFFAADLIRILDENSKLRTRLDFIRCSSYGDRASSSGEVTMYEFGDMEGDNILLIEDIIDSGKTLEELQSYLKSKGKQFKTCVLLDKGVAKHIKVDFIGFRIPRIFVGGYGLDYAGMFRGLPEIVVIKKELLK